MAQATEVVFLPLKEGNDPQKLKATLETILKHGQPQRIYAGAQVEHPNVHNFFIDWTSIGHHEKFTEWDGYKAFLDDAVTQCTTPPDLYHVHFEPFPPSKAFSEVTEFLNIYFPADYSAEDQKTFHENMKKFGGVITSNWEGCRGTAGGWVAEEREDPKSGEKARVYVELIGWESVDSHMKFREQQAFKDNIHLLRGAKDLKNLVMVHVAAKEFKG
ncbi:uncharacterized protein Z520_07365 [Fonsecaea multimorphosa CBS 102226]|uniref:ABM domain-containing protein n=1 Tax=Fonsecaea multimorphosa CBS 102226 TaxID=1442371 RepID=A0A0D2IHX6_9EURO|nr:uncharacterized protein Z520_07365 [Fonsecaea multimorphosa CBS 102226]KIX96646.1 hypothetical protein Z520_07365 [Fonsecaea multimorphosa CBS 102226]OAL20728.1 hypothetical protein AYO22_08737 [Fonsecaea multimorphosa]